MRRIEFKKGEKVGSCEFLKEVEPHKYPNSKSKRKAIFKCYCGKYFEAVIAAVKNGHTNSCGCYNIQSIINRNTKHGLRYSAMYPKWNDIKKRCLNPNNKAYKSYGGRGITICDEWLNNPKAFIDYVLSLPNANKSGLSIDRINNDGNYEPGNIRWATPHQQSINQRRRKNTTGFTGVSITRNGKYKSSINVDKVTIRFGSFKDVKSAVIARDQYIIKNNLTEYKTQLI